MNWLSATDMALYVAAGAALGAVYFTLLLGSVRLQTAGAAAIRVVPLYTMRAVVAVAAFWAAAQQGGLPLLLVLLGFLAARFASQRWMRPG